METRASYVLVGAFVLGLIVTGVFFVIWLAGAAPASNDIPLRVHFARDVTGLNRDANVRYRGYPVGQVTDIRISPEDDNIIEVSIRVAPDTPIYSDTFAALESQGLTGLPFVQLRRPTDENGVEPAGERLDPDRLRRMDPPYLIAGRPTGIQAIVDRFPKTLDEIEKLARTANLLAERAADFLDEDNRKRVGDLLETANETLKSVNALTQEITPAVKDFREAARAFSTMSVEIRTMITENRRPLADFAATGLYEFSLFLTDTRSFIRSANRLVQKFESDPSGFLFGDRQRGFETRGGSGGR